MMRCSSTSGAYVEVYHLVGAAFGRWWHDDNRTSTVENLGKIDPVSNRARRQAMRMWYVRCRCWHLLFWGLTESELF